MAIPIREYLQKTIASSKEIQDVTGKNQRTVARELKEMGKEVIQLKEGRTPKYALTRNAFGGDDELPLVMVDVHGNKNLVAIIRPLAYGGFFVEPITGIPSVLLGEKGNGLYDDLPFFLSDLAPQGFLGRQIAAEISTQSADFPSDPRRWGSSHIGRYLVSNGDDLPGNFRFGQQAFLRVRRKPEVTTEKDYPNLADSVMNGVIPGSSAGGEQPKFTTYCGSLSAHVIVKFSPRGDTDIARRWRDILITEFYATEAIHSLDLPAAETRLIEKDDRLFLESKRFDRQGEYGRTSMVSLHSIDAEFTGLGSNWIEVVSALNQKDLVGDFNVYDVEVLWSFGRLINNTDMHLGNLSFSIEGGVFRLLPVYDMCSMGFAPKSNGEVTPYSFTPMKPRAFNINEKTFGVVREAVKGFWQNVANDDRISAEFRDYLVSGNPIDRMQEAMGNPDSIPHQTDIPFSEPK
ncbi:MAG: type II toxin-antitoxin system HipA family toxin YjjJ [Thiotrichaceae bacterium]